MLIIPTLFSEGFTYFTAAGQNRVSDQKTRQPFGICWEIKNSRLNQIASDNHISILSENNGTILQINNLDHTTNWNIQLGNRVENIPLLIDSKILLLSHTDGDLDKKNEKNEKRQTDIRQINSLTGITDWIKSFEQPSRYQIARTENSKDIFLISEDLKIHQIDLDNGKILRSINLKGELETYTAGTDSIYILTTENSLFKIGATDGIIKSERKVKLKNISTMSFHNGLLILGNKKGVLYKLPDNSESEKMLFRTGGEIAYISSFANDILVTSNDNFLYYYSPEKEKILWKKRLPGRVSIAPIIQQDLIFTTTPVEPIIYVFSRTDGTLVNQINPGENHIIKMIEVLEGNINVLTNFGLTNFAVSCPK